MSNKSESSSRAFAAGDARFQNALRDMYVDFEDSEAPSKTDVTRIMKILDKRRNSPEPDSRTFHDIRCLMASGNESSVVNRMTPLLMPQRDLPINNSKTNNLLFQQDMPWANWGSLQPEILPTPKPDFCVFFKSTLFTVAQQDFFESPLLNNVGFYPVIPLEVKSALQAPHIADRQNANNMVPILIRDYLLQKYLSKAHFMERKIRFLAFAHDTTTMWVRGWFYVQHADHVSWHSTLLKHTSFAIRTENGFETARKYMLNWMEHVSSEIFPRVHEDSQMALVAGMISFDINPKKRTIRLGRGKDNSEDDDNDGDCHNDGENENQPGSSKRVKT